ncbi:Aste57867_9568 [Aphanomyces stellatus]|uniref:Aste57867_9568 protein n=1 Tax=Aphanomyces stellatus TaxID=120398 RepID=A0A485KN43_9STRA|nr:hypothetical protein As57867_009530 [Aphanomyces stellatus]VFT86447.1 Aste57867_9568 [Aphanomyces stellatus]
MDKEVNFGDDFGQKIDLTVRIREILRNYPEGTSVLKEMVQNADDAGATEISFCLDMRYHSTDQLVYSKLADFQGPSLMVYNNAQFTDADFQSIQKIGDSLKKESSNGWKTGRFGIGFNSVYHLTDLPTFVSGRRIVFFDPHACHLPNVNPSNPGKMIDFVVQSNLLGEFPNQFTPFNGFGCDLTKNFPGTTFRLPLRTPDQAQISRLSSKNQTVESIQHLLQEFSEETKVVLLFLRHVSKISIMEWHATEDAPKTLFTTSAKVLNNPETRSQERVCSGDFPISGDTWDYELEVVTRNMVSKDAVISRWLVCNQLGGGECSAMANHPDNAQLRLVPYGGVAANLDESQNVSGRAFCFLPLPVETGIPIHINGYFELSSNRRDIWFGDGLSGDGLLRAQWNTFLLKDVIAPCYARTIVTIQHKQPYLFPSQLPTLSWSIVLVTSTLNALKHQPCLFTTLNNSFVAPNDAIILDNALPDFHMLQRLFLQDGLPIVNISQPLQNLMIQTKVIPSVFSPSDGRSWYITHRTTHGANSEAMLHLIEFCLHGIDTSNQSELNGVQLIPLMNGSIGKFIASDQVDSAALGQLRAMGFSHALCIAGLVKHSDPSEALNWILTNPNVEHPPTYYLSRDPLEVSLLQSSCASQLVNLSSIGKMHSVFESLVNFNVESIQTDNFVHLLHGVFPASWKHKVRVDTSENKIPFEWFQQLWCYIGWSPNTFEPLQGLWPIIPTRSGALRALTHNSAVISGEFLSESLLALMNKVGVDVLASQLFLQEPHRDIWKYIQQPTPRGILTTLTSKMCDALNDTEKAVLRDYLLSDSCIDMDEKAIQQLKSLPIFPGCQCHVQITSNSYVAPEIHSRLLENDNRFILPNSLTFSVQSRLGVPTLDKLSFYWNFIIPNIPNYSHELQFIAVESLLSDITLFVNGPLDRLQSLSIFPSMTGSLKRIIELYDPDIDLFVDMVDPSCFPGIQTPNALAAMRLVGLQQTLTRRSICQLVNALSSTNKADSSRAKELLSYIDTYADRLLTPQQEIPRKSKRRVFFLKSQAEESAQSAEKLAEEMQDIIALRESLSSIAWLPVVTNLNEKGLPTKSPTVTLALPRDVRHHDMQSICSASFYILDGTITSKSLVELFCWNASLSNCVLVAQIYAMQLQNIYPQNITSVMHRIYSTMEASVELRHRLEGIPWLWIEGKFWKSSQVAFTSYIHLDPYLAVIPKDMQQFKILLEETGVRSNFNRDDYISILNNMHAENPTLTKEQLILAIQITQALSDMSYSSNTLLYIPNSESTLQLSTTLTYNDAPWIVAPLQVHFVHPQLSNTVAAKLGCTSYRSSLVLATSEHLQGVEAFGQSEPLTRRLSAILEQYPEGTSILNELVQNADDAQATRFKICYSRKSFNTSSLLSSQLASWQGPALICYNDAVFDERDFANLARIGQGHKLTKLSTTGRFGLGFNSVYHLTDIPSIVSGDSFVMFDPHASNVPNATFTHPGIKIRFTNSSLVDQFPDQFSPYSIFGCDMKQRFDGTLFRFPLRCSETSDHSDIKKSFYSDDEMLEFLDLFRQSLTATLLFLRHITHISVFVQDEDGGEPTLLFEGSAQERPTHLLDIFPSKPAFFAQLTKQSHPKIQNNILEITTSERKEQYLICHAIGCGQAKAMSLAHQDLKLIPYAAVAARLNMPLEGRAFSFLPLPVKVEMPIHINGYFELSSNRRDIWHGDDMTGEGQKRSQWNTRLLIDVVAPAYAALLLAVRPLVPNDTYLNFFPSFLPPVPWNLVPQTLFELLRDIPMILCKSNEYAPLSKIVAINFSQQRTMDLESILNECNIPHAQLPSALIDMLLDQNIILGSTSPATFRNLLRNQMLDIAALSRHLIPPLVKICIEDESVSDLEALPLVAMRNRTFQKVLLNSTKNEFNYFCTEMEQQLLDSSCSHKIVDMKLCGDLLSKLPGIFDRTNLKWFTLDHCHKLPIFPRSWLNNPSVSWDMSPPITPAWLRLLWLWGAGHVSLVDYLTEPQFLLNCRSQLW